MLESVFSLRMACSLVQFTKEVYRDSVEPSKHSVAVCVSEMVIRSYTKTTHCWGLVNTNQ